MTVAEFWSARNWSWGFGEYGSAYTIVPKHHIGLDVASSGWIPAPFAGRVVAVEKTGSMSWCVEVDTARVGAGRYVTFCHLANDALPPVGRWVAFGDTVGRTARGSEYGPQDYPGTAWDGEHVHFVISDYLHAAWTLVAGRTLADFYDPAIMLAGVLAGTAGVGSRPFKPPVMTGVADMFLFNGASVPSQFYLGTYEGRRLKVRPTLGIEAKVLLNAAPTIPRAQVTDDELVDLCAQGGYVFDAATGAAKYDGKDSYM